jgi:hypothetical protein
VHFDVAMVLSGCMIDLSTKENDMNNPQTAPSISTGITIAYSKGRGGTKWPENRHTAVVDGRTLMRKGGTERMFKSKAAALKAAQAYVETIKGD